MQKCDFSSTKNLQQLSITPYGQVFRFNPYPLTPFIYYLHNQFECYPNPFKPFNQENDIHIEAQSSNLANKEKNHQKNVNNDVTMDDNIKIQERIKNSYKTKLSVNNQFKYFDPHEAPHLTFGIKDISVVFKNSNLQFSYSIQDNKNKVKNQEFNNQYKQRMDDQFPNIEFEVKQPNSKLNPFLIIRKRRIAKRKWLTLEEYEKRGTQIQIKRTKNLKKMQVEQRIGKKLPIKNKKWRRKKPSLVFNAQQYKNRIISSKKFKKSNNKINQLFFSLI